MRITSSSDEGHIVSTVEQMLKDRLVELGADGLCNPEDLCGCGVEELAPCGALNIGECEAAKFVRPRRDDPEYMEEAPDGYFRALSGAA